MKTQVADHPVIRHGLTLIGTRNTSTLNDLSPVLLEMGDAADRKYGNH